jgi:hypothetical protein
VIALRGSREGLGGVAVGRGNGRVFWRGQILDAYPPREVVECSQVVDNKISSYKAC